MQNTKTPVMVLMELTVKEGLAPPDYQIISQICGTHDNRFDFVVNVAGVKAYGTGPSKQIAKHQSAMNALAELEKIGLYDRTKNPVNAFKDLEPDGVKRTGNATRCVVELSTICNENKLPPPEFIEISAVGPPHNREFSYECKISSITTAAKSTTKKMAKQLCAKEMLERLMEIMPEIQEQEDQSKNRLMETENDAIKKFSELREVIPDKSIRVDQMHETIARLMQSRELKYDDFANELQTPSEENLSKILERLEIDYTIAEFQKNPPIAVVKVKIDTPFTIMKIGHSFEEAKEKALKATFDVLNLYMQVKPSVTAN